MEEATEQELAGEGNDRPELWWTKPNATGQFSKTPLAFIDIN
jgi:hypothetical protein